ncbi:hypothetical protein EHI8A_056290 [Entamoeba histolytica HM-1:IMSS-B]|nr:hypothetical protein EHI8A_056290 [Entamoeba histolytica HM-1:IMSS-B]GAT98646.1 hypothetical protein CL6EHI_069940 [Entamoeba histolytica]
MNVVVTRKKYRRCNKSIKLSRQEALQLQVDFECVLLALLSSHYEFVMTKPQKKTKTSFQFMKVKEAISCDPKEDFFVFNVQKFIKTRASEMVSSEIRNGISYLTAQRRVQDLKHIETIHLFEDMLGEDYIFEIGFEDRDGIHGSIHIYFRDQLLYTTNQIKKIGQSIYLYINSKLPSPDRIIRLNELSPFLSL